MGRRYLEHSSRRLVFSVLFILATSGFYASCGGAPSRKPEVNAGPTRTETSEAAGESHDAVVYVNEAMLKKPYAVLGGTVENASGAILRGVTVEIELQRRTDGAKERRELKISPENLEPGERGSYALKVLSREWSDSRFVSLRAGAKQNVVSFKVAPGNRRPPERVTAPTPSTKVVSAQRPRRPSGHEEFINTPDNPVSVP